MARIRSVKPTFWTDEKIGLLARDVRLTFLGLISAMADDHGRLPGVARLVRGAVYPFDEDISTVEVERHLADLDERHLIQRYQVNGGQYIHIRNWLRHQKVEKPSPSLIPEPPRTLDDHSGNGRGTFSTERSGAEGMGRDGIESGADARARAKAPASSHEPAAGLPLLVDRFLETFYRSATPERREEIKQQLRATLGEEGARIRRGEFVKARNSAHLASCISDTIRAEIKNPDKAIVIVLKKLCDPELDSQRRTVTEAASERDKLTERRERMYHDAKVAAGKAWSKEHPDEAAQLEQAAIMAIPGDSQVGSIARAERVLQAIGEKIRFPTFDTWSPP